MSHPPHARESGRLPRHLIDLDDPRPRSHEQQMSTVQVQRWVTSALISTVLGLLAAGMVVAAIFSPESNPSARIGLNIMAGLTSVAAVVAARVIHGRRLASAWLILGPIVGCIGYLVTTRL